MNHQGVKAYVSVSASGDVDVGSNRERFVTRLRLPSSLPSLSGRGDVQLLSPCYPSSSMLIQQHLEVGEREMPSSPPQLFPQSLGLIIH